MTNKQPTFLMSNIQPDSKTTDLWIDTSNTIKPIIKYWSGSKWNSVAEEPEGIPEEYKKILENLKTLIEKHPFIVLDSTNFAPNSTNTELKSTHRKFNLLTGRFDDTYSISIPSASTTSLGLMQPAEKKRLAALSGVDIATGIPIITSSAVSLVLGHSMINEDNSVTSGNASFPVVTTTKTGVLSAEQYKSILDRLTALEKI